MLFWFIHLLMFTIAFVVWLVSEVWSETQHEVIKTLHRNFPLNDFIGFLRRQKK